MSNPKIRLTRDLYERLRKIKSVESSTAGHGDWSFTITQKDGSETRINYDDDRGKNWESLVWAAFDEPYKVFHGVAQIETGSEDTLLYDASHDESLHMWDGEEVLNAGIREMLWNNIEPYIAEIEKKNSIKIIKNDYVFSMENDNLAIRSDDSTDSWVLDSALEGNIKSQMYDQFAAASWLDGINKIRVFDICFELGRDYFELWSVKFIERNFFDIEIIDDRD